MKMRTYKTKKPELAKLGKQLFEVTGKLSALNRRHKEIVAELKKHIRCSATVPSLEVLTSRHRFLASWIKKAKIPAHWRKAHVKFSKPTIIFPV